MAISHFLAGLGLGIGLMAARARRISVRDRGLRLVDAIDGLPERAGGLARRMREETRDFAFDTWSRLQDGPPSDEVLAARVRAEVTRVAIRPGYLTVLVDQGNVTISGWATPEEFERLIETVRQVKGVTRVQSQLDAFGHPGDEVSSPLRGEGRRLRQGWSDPAEPRDGRTQGSRGEGARPAPVGGPEEDAAVEEALGEEPR